MARPSMRSGYEGVVVEQVCHTPAPLRPSPSLSRRLGLTRCADWRFFVAGSVSAALSHGYTTPIDVVKTRMQTNPELYNGTLDALQKIIENDGPAFLLQGLVPTCVGYGLEGALKFGSYEMFKPIFAHVTPSSFINYILAAAIAGAVAAVVLCPAEEVRIRMVADPDFAAGTLSALGRICKESGPFASLKGFPAMAAKQVPYTIGKQVSFDFCCAIAAICLRSLLGDSSGLVGRLAPVVAALPAAVLAAVLSHPGDTLLTAFYKGKARARRPLSPPAPPPHPPPPSPPPALGRAPPSSSHSRRSSRSGASPGSSLGCRPDSCMSSASSGCSSSCTTRSSSPSASPPPGIEHVRDLRLSATHREGGRRRRHLLPKAVRTHPTTRSVQG